MTLDPGTSSSESCTTRSSSTRSLFTASHADVSDKSEATFMAEAAESSGGGGGGAAGRTCAPRSVLGTSSTAGHVCVETKKSPAAHKHQINKRKNLISSETAWPCLTRDAFSLSLLLSDEII